MYLNELDQFIKHGLREKHYARYMDDFVIIHHDKAHLQRVRAVIEEWLFVNLQLKTNSKTQVFPSWELPWASAGLCGLSNLCNTQAHEEMHKEAIQAQSKEVEKEVRARRNQLI